MVSLSYYIAVAWSGQNNFFLLLFLGSLSHSLMAVVLYGGVACREGPVDSG